MKKKATLLIVRLHKVYTCQQIGKAMITLSNAYIGIFHDEILEIGIGDYAHLLDKDTRVIDAQGKIAVPGWIDCHLEIEDPHSFDTQRLIHRQMMTAMQHGVTTANIPQVAPAYVYSHYAYECLWNQPIGSHYPCVGIQEILHQHKAYQRFCIHSSYGSCDPLHTARLYYLKHHPSPTNLLKAMTLYPARSLQLKDRGVLTRGNIADIVLLNATSLSSVFSTLEENCIAHVIKRGVRIFPNVIV